MEIIIGPKYPSESFTPLAIGFWLEFLKSSEGKGVDVAFWEFNYSVICIYGFKSLGDPYEDTIPLTKVVSYGFDLEDIYALPEREEKRFFKTFRSWIENGVLEALESGRVQEVFNACDRGTKEFVVGVAEYVETLSEMPLRDISTIWSNGLSFKEVQSRQIKTLKNRPAQND